MLHFGEVTVETNEGQYVFEVQFYSGDLDLDAVRVELYADGINGSTPVRKEMLYVRQLPAYGRVYRVAVSATRPATDYTARVIPHYSGVSVPLEAAHILWQR